MNMMTPTAGQMALAQQIADGQARRADAISHVPVSVYVDPAHFEAEQARLFNRLPQVIAPSALIPERNMAVPHDGFGTPLLITRDGDGKAHDEQLDGMIATCLQHEMDHLEGILFFDHLSKLKRDMLLKKLAKQRKLAA